MNNRMILKLMMRDLRVYQNKFLILSLLMMAVCMLIIFVNSNAVGMFTGSTSSIVMVVIGVYIAELKNKSTWAHTASLPVTRKAIVNARFCTSLLVVTLNFIAWVCAFYLLVELIKPEWRGLVGLDAIVYSWVYLLFQLALFFFVFYRFNMIVALGLYILPSILWTVFVPKPAAMGNFVIEDNQLFLIYTIACVGLFCMAYLVAMGSFRKQDL